MFYGWVVVIASFFISMFVYGILSFGFSAFIDPLLKEFHWSYTQISLAGSIRGLEVGIAAPVMGVLVDRWGPRRLMFSGTVLIGVGLILLSQIQSLGMFYAVFAFICLGMSMLGPTVTMAAVSNWFQARLGIAAGIMHSGVGFSGLMVPFVILLIDEFGWRTAVVILGLSLLIIMTPVSLLVRNKPEHYGLLPDGGVDRRGADIHPGAVQTREGDLTPGQAMRSSAFWHIALAVACQMMMVNTVSTHIIPYLCSVGVSRTKAGYMTSVVPLASILGRVGFGWLGDRLGRKGVLCLGYAMMSLGMIFFTFVTGEKSGFLAPFVLLFSVGFGGNGVLRVALVNEFYGRRNFGTIYGFIMGFALLGHITGPPFAGWVFDRWGSYNSVWSLYVVAALIALASIYTASKPKRALNT